MVIKKTDYINPPSDAEMVELEKRSSAIVTYTFGNIDEQTISNILSEEFELGSILLYELGGKGSGGNTDPIPLVSIAQWISENISLSIIINATAEYIVGKGVEVFVKKLLKPKLRSIKRFIKKERNRKDSQLNTFQITINLYENGPMTTFLISKFMTKRDQMRAIDAIAKYIKDVYKDQLKGGQRMIFDTRRGKWIRT